MTGPQLPVEQLRTRFTPTAVRVYAGGVLIGSIERTMVHTVRNGTVRRRERWRPRWEAPWEQVPAFALKREAVAYVAARSVIFALCGRPPGLAAPRPQPNQEPLPC